MRTRDESGRLARDRGPRVFCKGFGLPVAFPGENGAAASSRWIRLLGGSGQGGEKPWGR